MTTAEITRQRTDAGLLAEAKWITLIDDTLTPVPRQIVRVSVLKSQAAIGDDSVLIRDHNSPNDTALSDDDEIDLAEGNVFYSQARCDVRPQHQCGSPAKLALVVDDRVEITTNPNQSGASVRGLFGLSNETPLLRDFESPSDAPIGVLDSIVFCDGPVFVTSRKTALIVVNGRQREVSAIELAFREVVELAFDELPQGEFICFTVTYRGAKCSESQGTLVDGDSVTITEGMVFNVTATDKS